MKPDFDKPWRGSRLALPLALLAGLTVIAGSGIARAQSTELDEFSIDRFQLAMDSDGLLDVDWAGVPDHLSWNVAVWFASADDLLVVYAPDGSRAGALVAQRMVTGLGGSLALWNRLELGVSTSIVVFQNNDTPGAAFVMDPEPLPSSGLGDLRLSPKLRLLGRRGESFHLSIIPALTVPLASANGYLRESRPTAEPTLALSGESNALRFSTNLGVRIRKANSLGSLSIENELFARIGTGYRFGDTTQPTVELALSASIATAAASPFADKNQSSVELLAGGSKALGDYISLFAAGGLGVTKGFGTPSWRALAGTRIKHLRYDRDRDGVADDVDQCPLEPEDLDNYEDSDGCPDPDNDGDGIADKKDGAPLEAEDKDGFQDEDGVPDPDNDGDQIADKDDKCPDKAETKNGYQDEDGCPDALPARIAGRVVDQAGEAVARAEVVISAGKRAPQTLTTDDKGAFQVLFEKAASVKVTVKADGFFEKEQTAMIQRSSEATTLTVQLKHLPPPGEIRGSVRSFRYEPLEATIRVGSTGEPIKTESDGTFELELPAGTYTIIIEVPGYATQERSVQLEENGVTVLNAEMRKKRRR